MNNTIIKLSNLSKHEDFTKYIKIILESCEIKYHQLEEVSCVSIENESEDEFAFSMFLQFANHNHVLMLQSKCKKDEANSYTLSIEDEQIVIIFTEGNVSFCAKLSSTNNIERSLKVRTNSHNSIYHFLINSLPKRLLSIKSRSAIKTISLKRNCYFVLFENEEDAEIAFNWMSAKGHRVDRCNSKLSFETIKIDKVHKAVQTDSSLFSHYNNVKSGTMYHTKMLAMSLGIINRPDELFPEMSNGTWHMGIFKPEVSGEMQMETDNESMNILDEIEKALKY
jgi:hypothetical protein